MVVGSRSLTRTVGLTAMDKQRVDLIDRFYEAFSRHDVDAVLDLCHEDIEIYKDPDVVEMVSALTPRGRSGWRSTCAGGSTRGTCTSRA